MAMFWKVQLTKLRIPENYAECFIKDICAVEQEQRYPLIRHDTPLVRVAGRSMYS